MPCQIPHGKGQFWGGESIGTLCSELYKDGWIDQDAAWYVEWGGSREPRIRWSVHWRHLMNAIEPSVCSGHTALLSNYIDQLLLLLSVTHQHNSTSDALLTFWLNRYSLAIIQHIWKYKLVAKLSQILRFRVRNLGKNTHKIKKNSVIFGCAKCWCS